jgi:hypothetical protein
MSNNLTMKQPEIISDLPFLEYNRRALYEISPERNRQRAMKAQPAGNFYCNDKTWEPLKYEGFAVVSMLNDNEGNEPLTKRLVEIQQELKDNLQPVYAFYQLPPDSFHQTVANTLSNERFRKNIINAGLEAAYPTIIAGAFDHLPSKNEGVPVKMRMAGLSIFGTAIGILGIFEKEETYKRVNHFRSEFYSNEQLAELDVKMTRPFIGHITLAYIEHNLNKNQRNHLADVINEINAKLEHEKLYFNITKTGLRRYYHLAEFIKQDNFPVYCL